MSWCLLPQHADAFKQSIISGELDPRRLAEMSSKERREFFAEKFGTENAEPMNRALETKLLLKNQQQGFITWANSIMAPKEVKRDIISKIERMDKVLDAASEDKFLEDLASHKLGTRVSFEEAQKISELSEKVSANESKKGGDDRMEYGRAVVELQNYVNDLKTRKTSLADLKANPAGTIARAVSTIPGTTKSIAASFDASAIFRQGWKTILSHPKIWSKNAVQSLGAMVKTFGKQNVIDELNADIVSRPTYDLMKKAKLDVGTVEEAYPSSLPEKIPLLKYPYKASENAFTLFTHKTRADIFDAMIARAEKNGVQLKDTDLQNIGRMVNALVGRGYVGALGKGADTLNVLFFSPRAIKAHVDTLLHPITGGAPIRELVSGQNTGTALVRKEAAKNLVLTIAQTAAILAIAKALKPDSVDLDPRSSDFGKIKVRGTRFDVTGGFGSLAVLAAREVSGTSKSTATGNITDLGSPKFGQPNRMDVLVNYFANKLSPTAGTMRDFAKGRDFKGNKMSFSDPYSYGRAGLNLVTPIPFSNAKELLTDPNAANALLGIIADGLGVSVNTYNSASSIKRDIELARKRGEADEVRRLEAILPEIERKEKEQKATQNPPLPVAPRKPSGASRTTKQTP